MMFKLKSLTSVIKKTQYANTLSQRNLSSLRPFPLYQSNFRFYSTQDQDSGLPQDLPQHRIFRGKKQQTPRQRRSQGQEQSTQQPQQTSNDTATDTHQESPKQLPTIASYYTNKFGKQKPEILDQWLEMSNENLKKECQKLGIQSTDKHIENIQNLFDYLKKFEQESNIQIDKAYQENNQGQYSQQSQRRMKFSQDRKSNSGSNYNNDNQQQYQSQQKESQGVVIDFKKHEEFMKNELNQLFSKRKKKISTSSQDNIDTTEENLAMNNQKIESQYSANSSSIEYAKPFTFDFQTFKSSLVNRGPLMKIEPQITHENNLQESQLIDQVFGLNQDQLDQKFNDLIEEQTSGPKECMSVIQKMELSKEDYSKLPTLSKKKVLINLTIINSGTNNNPNAILEGLSHEQKVIFGSKNWDMLTDKTKELFNQQVQQITFNSLTNKQLDNLDLQLALINRLDENKKNTESPITHQILENYSNKHEFMYKDVELNNAIKHAYIINQLQKFQDDEQKLNKVKGAYYSGTRKTFNKRLIRNISFQDKMEILKALPIVEGAAFSSQKSLHYMILNDILTHEIDQFEHINKQTIFTLIDKCMEMSKSRDLNNKLRGNLMLVQSYDFTLEDFHRLLILLSENKKSKIDIRLVQQLLMRRNLKTIGNISSREDLSKHIDLFEFMYKTNPIIYSYLPLEMKFIMYRTMGLGQEQKLSFQDMTRLSKILIPSLYNPQFFFSEMIQCQEQSFKTDVMNEDLLELVDQITKRVQDGQIQFEHLQLSTSRIHKNYKPYTEKTFLLLQRILGDLSGAEMYLNHNELKVVYKMLQCEPLVMKLFRNSEQAAQTLKPLLESGLKIVSKELEQINEQQEQQVKDNENGESLGIDFQMYNDMFKSLTNIQPIISQVQDLDDKRVKLAKMSLDLFSKKMIQPKNSLIII